MPDRVASETELIQTYLAPLAAGYPGALELKDDAAIVSPPPGTDLVVTTDPIIAGIHFFASDRADDIAWKALAVNVSDLAAKGAAPLAYTMALAFPAPPEREWMALFARGLSEAQAAFGCTLIGGDTDHTTGPLSVSITAFGVVPAGGAVKRTTAALGDEVFVSGTLGDAALGLALHRDPHLYADSLSGGDRALLTARYLRPHPRLALAPVLRTYASAALDVSDGFVKDLRRLAAGPGGGARVALGELPVSASARQMLALDVRWAKAIATGGDDYEILFAVAPDSSAAMMRAAHAAGVQVTRVATIRAAPGVEVLDAGGQLVEGGDGGYDHFA